ncbi:MAG: GNAT family N-acetyltransferase [SAR202 cluster bacterium]|nr:GNAT family N-acetyltransferase [SAR202 cluster bacterium]
MPRSKPLPHDLPTPAVILRDGRSIRLRPIRPDDKKRMEELFYRLSPRTRYLRFQYAKNYISGEELKYYTEVTPPDRFAYVATIGEEDKERIIAVGRWDMVPKTRRAEVAFVVEDQIQLGGIGTALLETLANAAVIYGIEQFVAQTLVENSAMTDVFEKSGFRTSKTQSEGTATVTIDIMHREEYEIRHAYREHVARSAGIRSILYPRNIAVIGASREPSKVGGALFRNLLKSGFTGAVFPVNPTSRSVAGVLAYPTIKDVPAEIDLAVIVVPAPQVLDAIDQCAAKGVRGAIVISAGFGEVEEGKERQRQLKEKILSYGIRMIGPNCLGVLNNDQHASMNASFAPVVPPGGKVSMGSQSGALGLALLDYARSLNLGMAHFVSVGNRVDVSSNDLLEFWEDDPNTEIILLYLETFGNPRKFSRISRRISRKKPIIVVKGGRTAAGARAASSHTGALASTDVAVDALFRQAGVIRVNTIEEMFGVAQVLAHQPLPRGKSVAIVTNAGGPGILAADACETWGLTVTPLSLQTQAELRKFLPSAASVSNPVDMLASATPEHYNQTLSTLMKDMDIDAVLCIYIPPLVTHPEEVAAAVRDAVSKAESSKTVVACFMMSEGSRVDLRVGPDRYIPSFVFPENAVQALARAYNYTMFKEEEDGRSVKFVDIEKQQARAAFDAWAEKHGDTGWLPLELVMSLLRMYGVPAVETRAAFSPDEAVVAAAEIGYPVAMKVRSSTVVHKTDVGGIALGLTDAAQVRKAYEKIENNLTAMGRASEMEGVVLQPMVPGGQEVIVGMTQDALFGPLVMVGLGGVQVEMVKDVAFSLHPLKDKDPRWMLRQLKSLPLLTGWRGSKPRDVEKLKEVLLRFSALVEDFPEIDQMEINPLLVFDEGHGCTAIDARLSAKA